MEVGKKEQLIEKHESNRSTRTGKRNLNPFVLEK